MIVVFSATVFECRTLYLVRCGHVRNIIFSEFVVTCGTLYLVRFCSRAAPCDHSECYPVLSKIVFTCGTLYLLTLWSHAVPYMFSEIVLAYGTLY